MDNTKEQELSLEVRRGLGSMTRAIRRNSVAMVLRRMRSYSRSRTFLEKHNSKEARRAVKDLIKYVGRINSGPQRGR